MQIEPGHALAKITHYELHRADDKIRLCVAEVIAGGKAKFIAYPVDALGMLAPHRFHGEGTTEPEALQACIRLIEQLSQKEIFPRDEMFSSKKK